MEIGQIFVYCDKENASLFYCGQSTEVLELEQVS